MKDRLPLMVAFFTTHFVLFVGSLLSIWVVWKYHGWEMVGYSGTLWQALDELPSHIQISDHTTPLWLLHWQNLVHGTILLIIAFVAGFFDFWKTSRFLGKKDS